MKKHIILTAAAVSLTLVFTSCTGLPGWLSGGTTADVSSDATGSGSVSEATLQVLAVLNGEKDLDSMTQEELLALQDAIMADEGADSLRSSTDYDLYYSGAELKPDDPDAELTETLVPGAQVVTVSDDPWITDRDYEALDISANMSPEDKAQYQAMLAELDNFDAEEFQSGIDEAIKGIEGLEDYDPSAGETDDPYNPGETQILNEWPDNEFSRQVPQPPFGDAMIMSDDESLVVTKAGVDIEEVKAYVSSLKAAGFTVDADETDQEIMGMRIYSFSAKNSAGYEVSVSFSVGTVAVNVSK